MKKSLISVLTVIIVLLCGCSDNKSVSNSYIGLYTDNVQKLNLKDDLTYELKRIENQNVIEGDYYVEDDILYMFSEYTKYEYAIKNESIYMIYEGNLNISDNCIEGELICKDKSDMPAIYTYSFKNDGTVDIIFDLGEIHNEGEGIYKVNGDNIEIDTGITLEKDGNRYLRLLYGKVK